MDKIEINREAVRRIIDSPVQTAPERQYPAQPYTTFESDLFAGGSAAGQERLLRYRQDPARFRLEEGR